ncbi:hypothetical protein D3C85_1057740 [compost metagenome]
MAKKHAHGHDHGEAANHVLGQESQVGREVNDQGDAEENRQRDDADFVGAQAMQEPAFMGAFDLQGLLIGIVHVAISSCCFYRGLRELRLTAQG